MSAQDFDPEDYTQDAREASCIFLSREAKTMERLYKEAAELGLENAMRDTYSTCRLLVALLQLVMPNHFEEAAVKQRAREAGL